MATTTPNFGWAVPTSSDLVKNGAVAIETLGDSIDASLVDLKGGTTGQVLKKATNTDMDFVWGAAGAGSPLTTKGDLYTYTTTDARLAVGADYGFLQALASESTGLQWNSGAWTSYTPTITAGSGTLTTASATGAWIRIGKVCIVQSNWIVTTNGTGANFIQLTLPFTVAAKSFAGVGREYEVVGKMLQIEAPQSDSVMRYRNYDNTYPAGSNYKGFGLLVFEVA